MSDNPSIDPFDHPALAEVLVVLSIVTSPVRGREAFIRDLLTSPTTTPTAKTTDWVVVDSDGEDEAGGYMMSYMKENDLVAILNQIPVGGKDYLPT